MGRQEEAVLDSYSPYDIPEYPRSYSGTPLEEGHVQGVLITMERDAMDEYIPEFQGWFAERDEVEVIDFGTTDKQEVGCIMIEWYGYQIDPLFLTILAQREAVIDFVVYGRN